MKLRKLHLFVLFCLSTAACDGGIETESGVQAPSLAAIRLALQASNAQGIVVGASLSDIVLPAFTQNGGTEITASTCYTVADLPAWLEFDSLNHSIRLASGQNSVPTAATSAITVTYACTVGSETDSVEFVLNDMDGGGLVDQAESSNVATPVVNRLGTLQVDAGTESFFLMDVGAGVDSAITVSNTGFDPTDASDDVADFDGDGVNNDTDENIFVAASSADFSSSTNIANADYRTPEVADFNADGNLDLALTNPTVDAIHVMMGNGDGTFDAAVSYATADETLDLHALDFDNDGDFDLVSTSEGTADNVSLSLLLNSGDGTFAANIELASGTLGDSTYLAAADFDSDGDFDFAQNSGDNSAFNVLLGDGSAAVTAGQDISVGDFPAVPAAADFNHDGFADLVLSQILDAQSSLFFGDGSGEFAIQSSVPVATASTFARLGDINNDGHIDLVVNRSTAALLQLRLGNGDGLFSISDDLAVTNTTGVHLMADFNGDGSLDIFATQGTEFELLLGDGAGGFTSDSLNITADTLLLPAPGDFDNDGDIDIVIPFADSDELHYFENQ